MTTGGKTKHVSVVCCSKMFSYVRHKVRVYNESSGGPSGKAKCLPQCDLNGLAEKEASIIELAVQNKHTVLSKTVRKLEHC